MWLKVLRFLVLSASAYGQIVKTCSTCADGSTPVGLDERDGCPQYHIEPLVLEGTFDCDAWQLLTGFAHCRCPTAPERIGICSVCPDGSLLPDASIVIPWSVQGNEVTCGKLETALKAANETECAATSQTFAAWCGCPGVDRVCGLCPAGQRLANPDDFLVQDIQLKCSQVDLDFARAKVDECAGVIPLLNDQLRLNISSVSQIRDACGGCSATGTRQQETPVTTSPTTQAPTTMSPVSPPPTALGDTTSQADQAPPTQAPVTTSPTTQMPTTGDTTGQSDQAPPTLAPVTTSPTTLMPTQMPTTANTTSPVGPQVPTQAPTMANPFTQAPTLGNTTSTVGSDNTTDSDERQVRELVPIGSFDVNIGLAEPGIVNEFVLHHILAEWLTRAFMNRKIAIQDLADFDVVILSRQEDAMEGNVTSNATVSDVNSTAYEASYDGVSVWIRTGSEVLPEEVDVIDNQVVVFGRDSGILLYDLQTSDDSTLGTRVESVRLSFQPTVASNASFPVTTKPANFSSAPVNTTAPTMAPTQNPTTLMPKPTTQAPSTAPPEPASRAASVRTSVALLLCGMGTVIAGIW